ncbi:hypothetical protein ACWDV4_28145 [Micromonospora sp. NPDC003197]
MSRLFSKKNALAGLATAGVLAVGVAAPTLAFAQDGDSATPKPSTSSSTTEGDKNEQRRTERQSEFAKSLAEELGVSQDQVEAALTKLREEHKADAQEKRDERKQPSDEDKADAQAKLKERLDQAVEDGKLTQEQADAIVKAYEAGVLPGADGPGGRGHGHGPGGPGGPGDREAPADEPTDTPEGTTGE